MIGFLSDFAAKIKNLPFAINRFAFLHCATLQIFANAIRCASLQVWVFVKNQKFNLHLQKGMAERCFRILRR